MDQVTHAEGRRSRWRVGERSGIRATLGAMAALLCVIGSLGTWAATATLPKPVITPDGGNFTDPVDVTITQSPLSELPDTPGWVTGYKYPGQPIEDITALSNDGQNVMALRARTDSPSFWAFAGASISKANGEPFPVHIWTHTHNEGYPPEIFLGSTSRLAFSGEGKDFWYPETGDRVFVLLTTNTHGTGRVGPKLFSCGNAYSQSYSSQQLADFAQFPVSILKTQPMELEFNADS